MKPVSMKYYAMIVLFVHVYFLPACTCSAQVITWPYELCSPLTNGT